MDLGQQVNQSRQKLGTEAASNLICHLRVLYIATYNKANNFYKEKLHLQSISFRVPFICTLNKAFILRIYFL